MLLNRRALLSGVTVSSLVGLQSITSAAELSALHVSPNTNREIRSVISEAAQLGLMPPSSTREVEQTSVTDLAGIVLRSFSRPSSDSRAVDLGRRAGILLSQLNRRVRDISPHVSKRPRAPAFDLSEQRRLKQHFLHCEPLPRYRREINSAVDLMMSGDARSRYNEVAKVTEIPWYVIAALHYREASLNFFGHLHNGDRLDRKTTHVPAARPRGSWPPVPFKPREAWKLSAIDALRDYANLRMASVERVLYEFERYNGWGFRSHGVSSPYLWSFSKYYTHGGYVCDGAKCWRDNYISKQAGLGVLLKALSAADPRDVKLRFQS